MKLNAKTIAILQWLLFILQNAIAQGLVPDNQVWGRWVTLIVTGTVLWLSLKGIQVIPPVKRGEGVSAGQASRPPTAE